MADMILIQPYTGTWDEMSIRLPEGLLAVAAVPASKGYDVRIIDQRICDNFEKELDEAVDENTKLFGLTAITGQQIKYALQVTRLLKEKFPNIPLVWGGVHATLVPEQTAGHPLVDYCVVGDGDFIFCELYERLRDGKSIEDLRGLVYKSSVGKVESNVGELELKQVARGESYSVVRKNGFTDVIRDLDVLPELPYQLLPLDKYSVFFSEDGRKSATMNTSRGCPFRCKFCADPALNEGKWRGFSAERVLEKVDFLHKEHGVRMFYFQDDYFPGSKRRFIDVLEGLKKYNREIGWCTLGIRADTLVKLTDEQWDLMYDSGCHSLEIGIESGNERVIKYINKAETLDQMREANRKLSKYDIKVKYTLIVGFPNETEEEINDTVKFAMELEKDNPNAYTLLFPFMPIVGTPFFEDAKKMGFNEPKSLEEWENMDFDMWTKKYRGWASPKLTRKLEAINFTSYFHNKNVAYKFGGSALLRTSFRLYHPIAKWRFSHQNFSFFFEDHLKDWVLYMKYGVRNLFKGQKAKKLDYFQKSLNASEV
jgi:anaerobic magnesium-protoporphyrin IX monomethyl ester cyclase